MGFAEGHQSKTPAWEAGIYFFVSKTALISLQVRTFRWGFIEATFMLGVVTATQL
jgi:hypothetical protein